MTNKSPVAVALRPELAWFADEMDKVLRLNDRKGGWQYMAPWEIYWRIKEELKEVVQLLMQTDYNEDKLIRELCDVANFCMFMADNIHHSSQIESKEGGA